MNKELYKADLFLLKLLPMIMAVGYFMIAFCSYLGVGWQIIGQYVGIVLAPLVFIYISSHVFKFCNYHRMPIYYVATVELLNITDYYIGIPISNLAIQCLHFGITAVFLIAALIMYIKKRRQIRLCNKNAEPSN